MPVNNDHSDELWGQAHKEAVAALMYALGITVVKVCDAVEQTWSPDAFLQALAGYAGAMASADDDEQKLRLMAELLGYVTIAIGRALDVRAAGRAALEAQVNAAFIDGLAIQVNEVFEEGTDCDE